ncbi:MAG: alanine racemase [Allosphingosinicella sp.]|uniref:alanine racemase n=1 Tax=Allosphingosinicella sp. TaxID=2823234 RepID=UPI00394126EA
MQLTELETPALLLDRAKLERNIARMRTQLTSLGGVSHRPHLKTAKSIEVARLVAGAGGPITVSTLLEAERFGAAGFSDILYAVGIAPNKLERVIALRRRGIDLSIVTDNVEAAEAVAAAGREAGEPIPVLIEIDSDGHRAGVRPDQPELLVAIARALSDGAQVRGIMTHAGGSYDARTRPELVRIAAQERDSAVACAETLRAAGFAAPVVSIGSTPTALSATGLDGVTEVRAGVYLFFDLVMHGIGVAAIDEIALSVLTTVIGHQRDKGWILVDAGWMAMSRDRGTANQSLDQGYGLVCDAAGNPFTDLIMIAASQEHGILAIRDGSSAPLPDLPYGTRLRILPNHACATAAQFGEYQVVEDGQVAACWPRFNGW